jgi:hypothetical protein
VVVVAVVQQILLVPIKMEEVAVLVVALLILPA